MILAEVTTGIFSMLALYVTPLKESAGYAVLVILALQGIVQVQLGYKLLKLKNNLDGLLKPFCYANMATGILFTTIFLIPLGVVVSAISDLMLGTLFLNMSKVVKNLDKKN
jgi:hypothetical protein